MKHEQTHDVHDPQGSEDDHRSSHHHRHTHNGDRRVLDQLVALFRLFRAEPDEEVEQAVDQQETNASCSDGGQWRPSDGHHPAEQFDVQSETRREGEESEQHQDGATEPNHDHGRAQELAEVDRGLVALDARLRTVLVHPDNPRSQEESAAKRPKCRTHVKPPI